MEFALPDILQLGLITVGFVAVGFSFYRNGRSTKQSVTKSITSVKDDVAELATNLGALGTRVEDIQDDIKDPMNGLSAIAKSVNEQAVNCATVSTRLTTEVEVLKKRDQG